MKARKREKIFISLGSNLGDKVHNLENASGKIQEKIGPITLHSNIYETEPWGYSRQPYFLNQVVQIETSLTPLQVLQLLMETETGMGRTRTFRNASRIIDLDILFYGEEIIHEKDLIIPHPSISARKFVLVPLSEIAPQFIHPVLKKPVKQLLDECTDSLEVHVLNRAAKV